MSLRPHPHSCPWPLSTYLPASWPASVCAGDHVLVSSYDRRVVWFDLDLSSMPYKTLKYHTKVHTYLAPWLTPRHKPPDTVSCLPLPPVAAAAGGALLVVVVVQAVRCVQYHRRYPLMASCSDDGAVHVFHSMVYE